MSEQGTLDLFRSVLVPVSDPPHQPAPIALSADVTAKHCSSMGALKAGETRETWWRWMLALYEMCPRTDAEIAEKASASSGRIVHPSTISARRNELIKMGKVAAQSCGTRKNEKTGISNSLWQLRKDA